VNQAMTPDRGHMNIKKFSQVTQLSAHTIRYYEKIGLLTHIARNSSGHRYFTDKDITWVAFITRLKETGMPLAEIIKYAQLRSQGEVTSAARMALLQQHAQMLKTKIAQEQHHLTKLNDKIDYYRRIIE